MKRRNITSTKRTFFILIWLLLPICDFGLSIFLIVSFGKNFILPCLTVFLLITLFTIYKIKQINCFRGSFRKGMITARDIDGMDGFEFEELVCDILTENDFSYAESTQQSGDFGVDVIAEKDGVTYAIQCKCYSGDVGIEAVQQVYAGRAYYNCHLAVVFTNQFYTDAAIELADKIGVLLWDRNDLKNML